MTSITNGILVKYDTFFVVILKNYHDGGMMISWQEHWYEYCGANDNHDTDNSDNDNDYNDGGIMMPPW